MPADAKLEDLLRTLTPQVLGALVRRFGHFGEAEDAVQEALVAAALQWPDEGQPANPRGWLIRVAERRLTDILRSEQARRRREDVVASQVLPAEFLAPPADFRPASDQDDTLVLLFMCCHPALSPASQIALTLRAVGGLTTAEIARAFLVPEATMAQRISRGKQRIKVSGVPFRLPSAADFPARLAAVLHVLYLVFNEGYTASSGWSLQRTDLSQEAIRLTRIVQVILPKEPEVAGLLALMLFTDARRRARTGADGSLVPLAEQDRGLWNRSQISEGVQLVDTALSEGRIGPYQLQAAIASAHDRAEQYVETDWQQILGYYELLDSISDNPVVTLNHAVAAAMVHGPQTGLEMIAGLDAQGRLAGQHRLDSVRAHLLEMAGDFPAAADAYRAAARLTTSIPERRYLETRAARISGRKRNVM
jgi:RNA polymerase sigma factor (sigma-70 family)